MSIALSPMRKKSSVTNIPYGSLSHHLKSPLASLQSILMITARGLKKEKNTAYATQLDNAARKIDFLTQRITQVMEYVRLQQDDPELLYSFFPLKELISETMSSFEETQQQRIRITTSVDSEVMGDRALLLYALHGVIDGLLRNGIGEIFISVSVQNEHLQLRLESKQLISQSEFSEESVELSLQMAIAYRTAEHHQGKVTETIVDDERVITLLLPLRQKS